MAQDSEDAAIFEKAVVSFFVQAADILGVPRSVAAIYGVCFANSEPLSFADIQGRLDVSQGSISQGLKVLREVGALKLVESHKRAPASLDGFTRQPRIARYEPDLKLRELVIRYLESRVTAQLESSEGALEFIAQHVPAAGDNAAVLKARVKQLQSWNDKTRALLPLIKTFLKLV